MKPKKYLKQKNIAKWAGLSESHLSELKSGTRTVSRNLALRVSAKTGKPPQKILGMTGPKIFKLLVSHFKKSL